jgi:predicted amidophosphoribosyltransferase
LRSEVIFGSLLCYSPRGQNEVSRQSRDVCYAIKAGQPRVLELVGRRLRENLDGAGVLTQLFEHPLTLVPMPRSAPLVAGALWPADRIARALTAAGLGVQVVPALERVSAVPKSARAGPGERPPISLQYESLRARSLVDVSDRILVVDDVVTKGATAIAAVSRLDEIYPKAQIALFAAIRTRGLVAEIEHTLDPALGKITLIGDEPNREP